MRSPRELFPPAYKSKPTTAVRICSSNKEYENNVHPSDLLMRILGSIAQCIGPSACNYRAVVKASLAPSMDPTLTEACDTLGNLSSRISSSKRVYDVLVRRRPSMNA